RLPHPHIDAGHCRPNGVRSEDAFVDELFGSMADLGAPLMTARVTDTVGIRPVQAQRTGSDPLPSRSASLWPAAPTSARRLSRPSRYEKRSASPKW
ncbi:hypothetical protein J4G37_61920, partial [Microvirga sp. 3-52]|nr:hypothetical protein [Microvirga sp. 3-52]